MLVPDIDDWWAWKKFLGLEGEYGIQYGNGYTGNSYNYKPTGRYVYSHKEIPESTMLKGIVKKVFEDLDADNVIILEHSLLPKLEIMMYAMDGKKEIYGKLIIEREKWFGREFPVVKDVLIPYQEVSSAHFYSPPEFMAKWMDELNRDSEGKLKPAEEVNAITSKMLGHFHSHDSVGGIKASSTDTEDMIEHREGVPFWIELIGSKDNIKGRIALMNPTPMLVEAKVVRKWWGDWEDMFNKIKGKIFESEKKWVSYTDKKVDETKNITEVKSIQNNIIKSIKVNPKRLSNKNDMDQQILESSIKMVEWLEDNPLAIEYSIIPKDKQKEIADIIKNNLLDTEKIWLEVWSSGVIDFSVYIGYVWSGSLFDVLKLRNFNDFTKLITILEEYGLDEDLSSVERKIEEGHIVYEPLKFNIDFDKVSAKTMEQWFDSDVEDDIEETNSEIDDENEWLQETIRDLIESDLEYYIKYYTQQLKNKILAPSEVVDEIIIDIETTNGVVFTDEEKDTLRGKVQKVVEKEVEGE